MGRLKPNRATIDKHIQTSLSNFQAAIASLTSKTNIEKTKLEELLTKAEDIYKRFNAATTAQARRIIVPEISNWTNEVAAATNDLTAANSSAPSIEDEFASIEVEGVDDDAQIAPKETVIGVLEPSNDESGLASIFEELDQIVLDEERRNAASASLTSPRPATPASSEEGDDKAFLASEMANRRANSNLDEDSSDEASDSDDNEFRFEDAPLTNVTTNAEGVIYSTLPPSPEGLAETTDAAPAPSDDWDDAAPPVTSAAPPAASRETAIQQESTASETFAERQKRLAALLPGAPAPVAPTVAAPIATRATPRPNAADELANARAANDLAWQSFETKKAEFGLSTHALEADIIARYDALANEASPSNARMLEMSNEFRALTTKIDAIANGFSADATPTLPTPIEKARETLRVEQTLTNTQMADTHPDYDTYPDVAATKAHIAELAATASALNASSTPEEHMQLAEQFRDAGLALRSAVNTAYFQTDTNKADALVIALQALPDGSTDFLTRALIQELNSVKNQIKDSHISSSDLINNVKPQLDALIVNMQTRYDERLELPVAPTPPAPAAAPAPAEPAVVIAARPAAVERAQEDYNQCLQRLTALGSEIKEKLKNENKNKFAGVFRPSTYANQELNLQIGREVALLQKLPYTPQIQRSVLGAKGNSFGNHEKTSKNLPVRVKKLLEEFHEEAQRALQIAAAHRNDYIAVVGSADPVIVSMQRNQTLTEAYTAAKENIPQLAAQHADTTIHGRLDAGRADGIKYTEKQLNDNQIRIHTVPTALFDGKPRYAAFCETQKSNAVQSTLMQLPDTLNPKAIWESVCVQAVKDAAVIKELKLPDNLDPKIFAPVFAKIEKAMQEKSLSTSELIEATKKAFKELGIDKSQIPNPNDTAARLATMFDKTRMKHMSVTDDKGNTMPHPDLIKIAMQQLQNLSQMKPHEKEVNISHASSAAYVFALKLCAHHMNLTVNDRSPYKNYPEPTPQVYKNFEIFAFKNAEQLGIPKLSQHSEGDALKNVGKDAASMPTRRP